MLTYILCEVSFESEVLYLLDKFLATEIKLK